MRAVIYQGIKDSGGMFGYSETFGGYPGGQAEFMRVPYGNFTPFRIPDNCEVEDEKLVLLADAAPTAYWSVDNAALKKAMQTTTTLMALI